MATELKVLNQEGKAEVFSLPDTVKSIDYGAMGIHSADEVTGIKLAAIAETKAALERTAAELKTSNDVKVSDLETKLAEFQTKDEGGGVEMINLRQQLKNTQAAQKTMSDMIVKEKSDNLELQYKQQLQTQASKIKLDDDGSTIFQSYARLAEQKNEDGTKQYKLATGIMSSLEEFAKEFAAGPVGKKFIVSKQQGGTGSDPGTEVPPSEGGAKTLAEFRKTHRDKT